jgi:hypothetical protein
MYLFGKYSGKLDLFIDAFKTFGAVPTIIITYLSSFFLSPSSAIERQERRKTLLKRGDFDSQ